MGRCPRRLARARASAPRVAAAPRGAAAQGARAWRRRAPLGAPIAPARRSPARSGGLSPRREEQRSGDGRCKSGVEWSGVEWGWSGGGVGRSRVERALTTTVSPMHTVPRLVFATQLVRTGTSSNTRSPNARWGNHLDRYILLRASTARPAGNASYVRTCTQRTMQSNMTITENLLAHATRRGGSDQAVHDHLCAY